MVLGGLENFLPAKIEVNKDMRPVEQLLIIYLIKQGLGPKGFPL